MTSENILEEMDRAMEEVLGRHFDFYFDTGKAQKALKDWVASRKIMEGSEDDPNS
jgi:hypothetical protein